MGTPSCPHLLRASTSYFLRTLKQESRGCPGIRGRSPVFDGLWPGMTESQFEHPAVSFTAPEPFVVAIWDRGRACSAVRGDRNRTSNPSVRARLRPSRSDKVPRRRCNRPIGTAENEACVEVVMARSLCLFRLVELFKSHAKNNPGPRNPPFYARSVRARHVFGKHIPGLMVTRGGARRAQRPPHSRRAA